MKSLIDQMRFSEFSEVLVQVQKDKRVSLLGYQLRASVEERRRRIAGKTKTGDRVILPYDYTLDWIVDFLAVEAAGCVAVPVPLHQVPYAEKDSGAALLVRSSKSQMVHLSNETERPPVKLSAILYTSGSTGFPKGVMLSRENLLAGMESVSEYYGLKPSDVIWSLLAPTFDAGLNQILSGLYVGAKVVLTDARFLGASAWAAILEEATVLTAIPTLWSKLVELPEFQDLALRLGANTGGALSQRTIDKIQTTWSAPLPFLLMYGFTEAFRGTYIWYEKGMPPTMIGKSVPHAEVTLDGTEIIQRGPLVSMGYWNNPEATRKKFRFGAARSGDVGVMDEDGNLHVIGRQDDLLKRDGVRYSSFQLEEMVRDYFKEDLTVVVVGLPEEDRGQRFYALVEREDSSLGWKATRVQIGPIEDLVTLDRLPRLSNQKLDRTGLRQTAKEFFSA